MPSRFAVTWAVLKRELGAYFLSPITYILMALFLCVQGYSFFLVCQALTNQRASTAAVMQYFFGGTFVYWVFLTFLVAALTMRLVAEERVSMPTARRIARDLVDAIPREVFKL